MRLLPILLLLVFALSARLEKPGIRQTPANERLLEPGETNPPITPVNDHWPLPAGTPIWFHPDRSSFATLLDCDEEIALIRLNSGDDLWIKRALLRKAWVSEQTFTSPETLR